MYYRTPNAVAFVQNATGQLAGFVVRTHDVRPLHALLAEHYKREGLLPRDGDSLEYQTVAGRRFSSWTPRGWFYGAKPQGSKVLSSLVMAAIEKGFVEIESHHTRAVKSAAR
jgi:hypothetical protein